MPSGPITFLDLRKLDTSPGYDLIEENVQLNPEIAQFPADIMPGTDIQLTVRTDLPTLSFSNIGEGVSPSKSGYQTRMFQTANLDALVKVAVNMLEGKPPALAGRLMAAEQAGFVEAAIRKICAQTWYGVQNDAKGFIGIIAQMLTDALHVTDAGGAENKKTSIYFVAVGTNKAQYWFGSNRTLTFDDWYRQTVKDANNLDMEAETSWMHCTPGFRLENRNAVVRINNITTEVNHTATFDLMNVALRQMRDDLGMIPTHIFMTGRTQEQLRKTLITALNPAPSLPKDFEGVPFYISNNISNAEQI